MDWLKLRYDRAALLAGAIALLVCGGIVIVSALDFPRQFEDRNSRKPADNVVKPLPSAIITSAMTRFTQPRTWNVHDGSLFVSRPYILIDGKLVDPLEGTQNIHDPIKNSWVIQYDLPYWETDLKDQDPDEDQFTNVEEFLGGTNPRDNKSVPPYYTKLRLKKFISKPFRLVFTGSPDGGQTFTINAKDRGSRTQFRQLGEMIEGTPYKLLSYTGKKEQRNDIETDTSELTIENTETGQKLVLVAKREANDPTSFAEFLYLFDHSSFTVKKDDDFTLAPQTERKYKLIDISAKEAVIKDQKDGTLYKIPAAQ